MQKETSSIVKTVKKVMPAVVSIVVSKKLEELEKELTRGYPPGFEELGAHIPSEKVDARGMVAVGGGSGCIVTEDGAILTNKHVITEPFAEYTIMTENGDRHPARVLARDPMDDIAILKIETNQKLPTVALGNSDTLELGMTVLAFGNSLGTFKNTVSCGIISGLSRSIEARPEPEGAAQEYRGLIQTDAAINPGNSGGPLTDIFGAVVGINTAVVYGAQNIGFAIPVKTAERDLADLKKYGKIRRPLLGLRYLTVTPDIKEKLRLPVEYGALVVRERPLDSAVAPKSPAGKAGIQEQDIILNWNESKINEERNIQDYLEEAEVGQNISLTILRNGRQIKKNVILTERK